MKIILLSNHLELFFPCFVVGRFIDFSPSFQDWSPLGLIACCHGIIEKCFLANGPVNGLFYSQYQKGSREEKYNLITQSNWINPMNVREIMVKIFVCRGVINNPLIKWYSCSACSPWCAEIYLSFKTWFKLSNTWSNTGVYLREFRQITFIIRSYTVSW